MSWLMLSVLIGVVPLNLIVHSRVSRSDESPVRKRLFQVCIWLVPLLGALTIWTVLREHTTLGGRDGGAEDEAEPGQARPGPDEVLVPGLAPFPIRQHLHLHRGLPYPDWHAAGAWLASAQPPEAWQRGILACRRAWLEHLRHALGPGFRLLESDQATVLCSRSAKVAAATLDYMHRTRGRVQRVLGDLAGYAPEHRDILIVFEDEADYYRYASYYYPDQGEFGLSGGMFINSGCPHFVTVNVDLHQMEPVIAHEMTHAALAYLHLPRWLDEGLAVNTERRLTGTPRSEYTPFEMHAKHLEFWASEEVRRFWSGEAFFRGGDAQTLAYDLARILVETMARDWAAFARFVQHADRQDAGAAAAREHLGLDLGEAVRHLFGLDDSDNWAPAGPSD